MLLNSPSSSKMCKISHQRWMKFLIRNPVKCQKREKKSTKTGKKKGISIPKRRFEKVRLRRLKILDLNTLITITISKNKLKAV